MATCASKTMAAPRSARFAPVEQILVKNGKVTGVALENGDEHHADIVVSNHRSTAPHLPGIAWIDKNDLRARSSWKNARNFKYPRLFRQAQHRAGWCCRSFPALREGNPGTDVHADMHLDRFHGAPGARLRRLEGRHLVAATPTSTC